ncbi:MAG: DUF1990 domain-containing protein [Chloroflexi bacterium]|nr:DUF1990 domain-containing protein [Chloroflexota bacterium]MCI0580272.1 DUF1990 domain-containing protein [Chloroflexota bacterium]MCI0643683.1 DUF1990 domain-containing protein [Chloroflexota bacterium]MCI0729067.1 DUF1990 domain-containing protein [Chloroflexota bacterium]
MIRAFLAGQEREELAYREVGRSRAEPPAGYRVDHHRVRLGAGPAAFEAACRALRRWEMFQLGWVALCWPNVPVEPGTTVGVLVRAWGLWWLNASRIVYVLDEERRFGFAYGTLPGHAERGEERFIVEWQTDDEVWYDLLAFSRPGHWLVWSGYPLARRLQRRFARDSLAAMVRAVRTGG